jgi:hypothetical protein
MSAMVVSPVIPNLGKIRAGIPLFVARFYTVPQR